MNTVAVGYWIARRLVTRAQLMGIDLSKYYVNGYVFDSRFDTSTHCWLGAPIGDVGPEWAWDALAQGEKGMEAWSEEHASKPDQRGRIHFRLADEDANFVLRRAGKLNGPVGGLTFGC